jgi:hypothetical protein
MGNKFTNNDYLDGSAVIDPANKDVLWKSVNLHVEPLSKIYYKDVRILSINFNPYLCEIKEKDSDTINTNLNFLVKELKEMKNLVYLIFDGDFNYTIDLSSLQLTHLHFSYKFNRSINNLLPKKLQCLNLVGSFNQIVNLKSTCISHLTFGYSFNNNIENLLPDSLIYLELGYSFDKSLNNLPPKLEYLKLSNNNNFNLYDSIKILQVPLCKKNLSIYPYKFPNNLEIFIITTNYLDSLTNYTINLTI